MPVENQINTRENAPSQKGFFGRLKDTMFTREGRQEMKQNLTETVKGVGKALPAMVYKTTSSILGVKFVTDMVGRGVDWISDGKKGWGDYAQMAKDQRQKESIAQAFQEAYEAFRQDTAVQSAEPEAESQISPEIQAKITRLEQMIDTATISSEDKEPFKVVLRQILEEHRHARDEAQRDIQRKAQEVIQAYTASKLSAMTYLKDIANLVLTSTGLFALRGVAYMSASVGERVMNTKKSNLKKELAGRSEEKEKILKDVCINSVVETLRGLSLRGSKEGRTVVQKGADFVKSVGTILRGIGIYGVALGDTDIKGAFDRLTENIEKHGVLGAVKQNFVDNAERLAEVYSRVTGIGGTQEGETADITPTSAPPVVVPDSGTQLLGTDQGIQQTPLVGTSANIGDTETKDISTTSQEKEAITIESAPSVSHIETINRGEGVLHGANRAIDKAIAENSIPELKDMSPRELHTWKIDQLKTMGFVFKDGKWGYPFTVHRGARVELFVDKEGKPQLRVLGDEGKHITTHKQVRFKNMEGVKKVGDGAEIPPTEEQVQTPEAEEARTSTKRFVNRLFDEELSTKTSVKVDKDFAKILQGEGTSMDGDRENATSLPSIVGILDEKNSMLDTKGLVRVQLSDGSIRDVYPESVPDTEDSFVLQLPEYSPAVPLPRDIAEEYDQEIESESIIPTKETIDQTEKELAPRDIQDTTRESDAHHDLDKTPSQQSSEARIDIRNGDTRVVISKDEDGDYRVDIEGEKDHTPKHDIVRAYFDPAEESFLQGKGVLSDERLVQLRNMRVLDEAYQKMTTADGMQHDEDIRALQSEVRRIMESVTRDMNTFMDMDGDAVPQDIFQREILQRYGYRVDDISTEPAEVVGPKSTTPTPESHTDTPKLTIGGRKVTIPIEKYPRETQSEYAGLMLRLTQDISRLPDSSGRDEIIERFARAVGSGPKALDTFDKDFDKHYRGLLEKK